MCCLATAGFLICCHEVASYHGFCFLFLLLSDGIPVETILHRQKVKMLPVDRSEYQRIVVRRKHLWEDALRRFRSGINFQNIFVSLLWESLQWMMEGHCGNSFIA